MEGCLLKLIETLIGRIKKNPFILNRPWRDPFNLNKTDGGILALTLALALALKPYNCSSIQKRPFQLEFDSRQMTEGCSPSLNKMMEERPPMLIRNDGGMLSSLH